MRDPVILTVTRDFAAPPERVFDAWLDPAVARRFLFAADPAESEWTRVTIDIAATDSGCTLTLTHAMDPEWAAYEEQTRHGWTTILDSLALAMEKRNG